jgi:hypothetical protein
MSTITKFVLGLNPPMWIEGWCSGLIDRSESLWCDRGCPLNSVTVMPVQMPSFGPAVTWMASWLTTPGDSALSGSPPNSAYSRTFQPCPTRLLDGSSIPRPAHPVPCRGGPRAPRGIRNRMRPKPAVHAGYMRSRQIGECNRHDRSRRVLRGSRSTTLPGKRDGPAQIRSGEESLLRGDP